MCVRVEPPGVVCDDQRQLRLADAGQPADAGGGALAQRVGQGPYLFGAPDEIGEGRAQLISVGRFQQEPGFAQARQEFILQRGPLPDPLDKLPRLLLGQLVPQRLLQHGAQVLVEEPVVHVERDALRQVVGSREHGDRMPVGLQLFFFSAAKRAHAS